MAITRVGAASADTTSVTVPGGHQAGDLMVIYAFRSALTAPSLPAGWTSIQTQNTGASSYRIGWKIAGSSSETSGTWTNATGVCIAVYRGTATNKPPTGATQPATATSTSINYGIIQSTAPTASWLLGFGAIKVTTDAISTPPSGMTNITDTIGATCEYAAHDTNGPYPSAHWNSTLVGVTNSAEWRTYMIEIVAEQGLPANYQFVKVGDGMSVSERIR